MINVIAVICAYLIGSIPSGLWIGKIFYKTDIREFGSGNLGATNTFRVLGKSWNGCYHHGYFKRYSSNDTTNVSVFQ